MNGQLHMKNKKVYIRLIITYLVVFTIPMLMNLLMLEKISNSTQENICQSVLTNLNHTRENFDNSIEEIDLFVEKMSGNLTIRYIAGQMDEQDKLVEISKIKGAQDFMEILQMQTFVDEYYLYFHKSDMIISPKHVYLNADRLSYDFQYGDMSWEEWREAMHQGYSSYFFEEAFSRQNQKQENRILYVQSLVNNYGVKGNFIFPISSEKIKSLLRDSYVANSGWAYVTDKDGRVLLTVPAETGEFELVDQKYLDNGKMLQEASLNGRNVEIIRSVSSETGLNFIAVLPKEYITSQINQAQKQNVQVMLLVLAAGMCCVLIVTWHRGKKLDDILDMLLQLDSLRGDEVKGDELSYISQSLKQLIEHHEDLKENVLRQRPVTRGLLLERLLWGGEFQNRRSLEEYGIYLQDRKLLILLFQLDDETIREEEGESHAGDDAVFKSLFMKGLSTVLSGDLYLCDTDIRKGAVICALDSREEPGKEALLPKLNRICEKYWEECNIWVRIAVSDVCENVNDLSKAYDQAYEMLQYGTESDKNILFCEDYRDSREYYYFPVNLEERLVNAIRTGNLEGMHNQLREVYQINVMERNISPAMMHFLVNDLQCTVFKVLHGLRDDIQIEEETIQNQLAQLNDENDILLRFNRINSIFRYICEQVQAQNSESITQLKEKIIAYIGENYSGSDMSLTKIADDFGYASTYFSKLFKDLFGENFVTYLEKVRIEQVCLLLEGGDTLEKIADRTGYNSVYVMRTAFKRIKGMTPNEYRKIQADRK